MPPKKELKPTVKGAPLADNDLSDVANLPILNDFIFTTLYAFKYRLN